MFLVSYFGKVPKAELISTIIGFYDDEEVSRAKELLFEVAEGISPKVDGLPRQITRKASHNKRRLDCEDLIGLLELLDRKMVALPEFHAANLGRVPRMSPSDVDQVRLAETVAALKELVSLLSTQLVEVRNSLAMLSHAKDLPGTIVNAGVNADKNSPAVEVHATEHVKSASFADLLQTTDDNGQWFIVNKKQKTLVNRKITGKGVSDTSIKVVERNKQNAWHIFVGHLDPATTADDLSKYLKDAGISVFDCKLLQKREKWQEKFSAFRVVVDIQYKDRIFDEGLWPLGCDVRDWVFTGQKRNDE